MVFLISQSNYFNFYGVWNQNSSFFQTPFSYSNQQLQRFFINCQAWYELRENHIYFFFQILRGVNYLHSITYWVHIKYFFKPVVLLFGIIYNYYFVYSKRKQIQSSQSQNWIQQTNCFFAKKVLVFTNQFLIFSKLFFLKLLFFPIMQSLQKWKRAFSIDGFHYFV